MAHVLCVTSGLAGILHASFELVRRLGEAGHRVTYLSPSPVADEVGAQGIPFVPLPPFGIHTVNECLHFGVPMLVYSGKRYDQDGCAARVAYHGLGVRGDKGADPEAEIERKLERVLTDAAIRQAVDRFQAAYQRTRQSNPIAALVEAHLPT